MLKIYTVEEVAEIMQVTKRTVYRWIDSKALKASKIGKYWRIAEKDLLEFIEERSNR